MTREHGGWLRRGWQWWLRYNPMYLLSALCMALGARLYLVHPRARAGELGLILLTLGVLQFYEWAVTTVLLALHRWRRSPEDKPSLMLVAALFWTGPLAATAEMTAHRMDLGLITAVGAGLVCLVELAVLRRAMGLRIGLASQAAAGACLALLVAVPPLICMPGTARGLNELFLYAAWWALAAITLLGIPAARACGPGRRVWAPPAWPQPEPALALGLLAVAVGATVAHLAAMNYAYFAHAGWFYASPLLVAATVVGMEVLATFKVRQVGWIALAQTLPAAALLLAWDSFAPEVPVALLPFWLRDPLFVVLLVAAVGWWYGGYRLRVAAIIHLGSVAVAAAGIRAVEQFGVASYTIHGILPTQDTARGVAVLALYGAAAYLMISAVIRRSRFEGVAALAVHLAAVTLLVWERMAADTLIVGLVGGWSWLVALHLLVRHPRWTQAVWPIGLVMLVAWGQDFNEGLRWAARLHGGLVVVALLAADFAWPVTGYRWLAAGAGLAHGLFLAGRVVTIGSHGTEACVVMSAFVLLGGGAAISWFKRQLLERVQPAPGMEAPTTRPPGDAQTNE